MTTATPTARVFKPIPSPGRTRPRAGSLRKTNSAEQGVPVYDPQAAAMRWLSLAAMVYSTAVGRA